jgi:aspartate-semialdehyde dehydrogenase
MAEPIDVAVVGATGAVGKEMIEILQERNFPVKNLYLFASSRSAGTEVTVKGKDLVVNELMEDSFAKYKPALALFSAGASISRKYAPLAVDAGCLVVDNSSAFRMEPEVPLVVPEVNPHAIDSHQGIIANPNCSTIQMVVALKPIHDAARIKRIVVSTYQAVSGTGSDAMEELFQQAQMTLSFQKDDIVPRVYPHQIAFNCLPHIGDFLDSGYTQEEMKMVHETRKIMEEAEMKITATTVRVPIFIGHSESVNVECEKKISAIEAMTLLTETPGVEVIDDVNKNLYPIPLDVSGRDEVFVGRIREDNSVENGLDLWIVADNLRKGAALNAIQIAEIVFGYSKAKIKSKAIFATLKKEI